MDTIKQINIKNRTYYFYNDIIDLEDFNARLLKIDKKLYKDTNIYNIGYVTKKKFGNCMNINSVNPLYLGITSVNGYIEEKGMDKYLVFDSTDENKELLKKYNDVFNGIKDKIKEINNNEFDYGKSYLKIKFRSDDDLPLNRSLEFCIMTTTIRHVFEKDGKLYPQVFLDDTLYELNIKKMIEYERIDISNGIDISKTNRSKECMLCHYCYFLDKNFSYGPYLCDGCYNLCKNLQILKILLLFILKKVHTEFIFQT